jgi:DNA invertase Pin-like site-specific DNA recombinase
MPRTSNPMRPARPVLAPRALKRPRGRAVAYTRISTDPLRQDSLASQQDLMQDLADELGLELSFVYTDHESRGVERPQMEKMYRETLADEGISHLLCWDLHRLWENAQQAGRLMRHVNGNGITLMDAERNEVTDMTARGRREVASKTAASQEEIERTRERILQTQPVRARKGQILTRPVYGTRAVKEYDYDLKKIVKEHVVDEVEIAVVREVFRRYASGEAAYRIAIDLNDRGVRTKGFEKAQEKGRTTQWTAVNLRRMMDNRFYIGELAWNKTFGEWVQDANGNKHRFVWPSTEDQVIKTASPLGCILADDPQNPESVVEAMRLFDKVQAVKSSKGRERSKKKYDDRVMAGMVTCGRCGYKMAARRFGHKLADGSRTKAFDYRCHHKTSANNGCQTSHTMTEGRIFAALETLFNGEATDRPVMWKVQAEDVLDNEVRIARSKKAVVDAQRNLAHINELAEAGFYDSVADAVAAKKKARATLAAAEEEVENAESATLVEPQPVAEFPTGQRSLFMAMMARIKNESDPIEERQALFRKHVALVEVDSPAVTVTLQPL